MQKPDALKAHPRCLLVARQVSAAEQLAGKLCEMSRLTLRMTKNSIDAIAGHAVMTQMASWSDASHLIAANLDVESRAVRDRYLAQLDAQRKAKAQRTAEPAKL